MTAPLSIDAGPVTLRHVEADYAAPLAVAINESLEHLRPWMDWAQSPATPQSSAMYLALQHERFVVGGDLTWLIFEGDGDVIVGGCGLHARHDDARVREVGYWLRPDSVGCGYASAAVAALLRLSFDELGLGLTRVVLRCAIDNHRSAAVARRAGFEHVSFEDANMVWVLHAETWKGAPCDPSP